MPMDRREKEKQKARRQTAMDWAEEQDQGFERTAVKLPDGCTAFKPKKDSYRLDLVPYLAGEGNPDADAGFEAMCRIYFVHNRIGPRERPFICPRENWGKPCPVCEERGRLERAGSNKQLADSLRPQKRVLWGVIDRAEMYKDNNKENGYNIQIWDTAYWRSFGQMLKDKLTARRKFIEDPDDVALQCDISSLEHGKTLLLSVVDDTFGEGRKYRKIADIEFAERKAPYPKSLLKEAPCLDELLIEVEYNELERIFQQIPEKEDKAAGKPAAAPSSNGEGEEGETPRLKVGDEVTHRKYGCCTITKVNKAGDAVMLEDEEGGKHQASITDALKKLADAPKKKTSPPPDEDEDFDEGGNDEPDSPGLKVGQIVTHPKHGECEVKRISKDGTTLALEDEEGEQYPGIATGSVKKVATADTEEEVHETAPTKKGKRSPVDEDEELEAGFEDEEEPPPVMPSPRKAAKKPAADDGDFEDSELPFEDEEEPSKKGKKSH